MGAALLPARPAGLTKASPLGLDRLDSSPSPAPALVLAFLLSLATNSPALYERHYVWLFWVNVDGGARCWCW